MRLTQDGVAAEGDLLVALSRICASYLLEASVPVGCIPGTFSLCSGKLEKLGPESVMSRIS